MSSIGTDFIDPDDPTYIAENELFNAAQSIESAAKKLSFLKPRRKIKVNRNKTFFFIYIITEKTKVFCHDMFDIWLFDV
jgi:hypothetical protein